jgi:hypothetical protein
MTMTAQALYELLPALYRIRDAERGEPLKALLSVMAEQIAVVEEDIDQLYENWFIETCEEWLVPYIGDLLGVRPLHQAGTDVFSLRAYVANTLAYRRRKGTVAVLEELARDVTGWPAKAVEFFELLATSQHLNHLRLDKRASLQVCGRGARDGLELLGGPFEKAAHTAEVRRIESGRGRYNIPNLGLYLWRLDAYTVLRGEARAAADGPKGCFRFNPLGYDAPLFNPPQTEEEITHLTEEINVPGILRRLPLYLELEARRAAIKKKEGPSCLYFSEAPVLEIVPDDAETPLAPDEIMIANLEGWEAPGWEPPQSVTYGKDTLGKKLQTKCAVDPVLGRLTFLSGVDVKSARVTYSYGFAGALGGGPYDRRTSVAVWYEPKKRAVTWCREVTKAKSGLTLKDAVDAWNLYSKLHPLAFGLIFISDNSTYEEAIPEIEIRQGSRLAIVAATCPEGLLTKTDQSMLMTPDNLRPHIIGDLIIRKPLGVIDPLKTSTRGEFIADGLLVEGAISVKSCNLGLLRLAHCTFASSPLSQKPSRTKPSATIATGNTGLQAFFDHCIVETIRVSKEIDMLTITDSIIDGGGKGEVAFAGLTGNEYGPLAEIERSTLLGMSFIKELYASETILTGEVKVERCQTGCVRFSYLALPADPTVVPKTPPRYRCQPCLEIVREEEKIKEEGKSVDPALIRKKVSLWLTPAFTSSQYSHPAYGQLSLSTPAQILTGAEDGAEMGVFCHLKQPQREANLRGALIEYLRSGLAAGILYARQENHNIPGGTK